MRTNLQGRRAIVVGASGGFGFGIAAKLARSGMQLLVLARSDGQMPTLAASYPNVTIRTLDAGVDGIARELIHSHKPEVLVLNAGARPEVGPIQDHSWESFSVNWHSDVRIAFNWLQAALLEPMPPGSHIIVMSSGAAIAGSPLSGGYAGAKATLRTMAHMVNDESSRRRLGIVSRVLHPTLTPSTDLGAPFIEAYAARSGTSREAFLQRCWEHRSLPTTSATQSMNSSRIPIPRRPTGCSGPMDSRRYRPRLDRRRRSWPLRRASWPEPAVTAPERGAPEGFAEHRRRPDRVTMNSSRIPSRTERSSIASFTPS